MNKNPIPTHIRRMAVLVVFIAMFFSVLGSPAASTAIAQEPTPTSDVSGQLATVDLAVTQILIDSPDETVDTNIYVNDDVKVYIDVYNLGDTVSGSFTVNIYLDSVPPVNPPVNPEDCNNIGRDYYYNSTGLGGGSFKTLQITIPAGNLIAGQYSITAYADSGCVIVEDDETNNIGAQEFTVHPLPQTTSAPDHDSVGSPRVFASLPYTDTVDVRGATRHASDPTGMTCTTPNDTRVVDAGLASVWYQYTATSNTTLFVDTFGSNYDTYLAAWQGGIPGVGSLIGCNEDSGGVHQSALSVPVTNGTTYYFLVAQFSNDITNVEVEGASLDGKSSTDVEAQAGGNLVFRAHEGSDETSCTPPVGGPQVFADVPSSYWARDYIEAMYYCGYTAGCSVTSPLLFCPEQNMNRAQSAVFLLRSKYGGNYILPSPPYSTFKDNFSSGPWAQPWAQGLYNAGMTAGCSLSGPLLFCPWDNTTRAQLAVFGLRMKFGDSYPLPPATGTVFADMPAGHWATGWAEQAYANGLILACGTQGGKPMFCPDSLVSRASASFTIVKAKNLIP
jgi:hypothetical protein